MAIDPPHRARINRLVIIALVSIDRLLSELVLKGGNALDLIYEIANRASEDLDFSIASSFSDSELVSLSGQVEQSVLNTFEENGYHAFDYNLEKRPSSMNIEMEGFWGGYQLTFKIISLAKYRELSSDIDALRRNALAWGRNNSTNVTVEISRHEFFPLVQMRDLDGYAVRVYSPAMIAIEKLRAICQQMQEYKPIIGTATFKPRSRDFYDIYTIVSTLNIDLTSAEYKSVIRGVFAAKRVPLEFLKNLESYREFHRTDFAAVRDTVVASLTVLEFDFYFDYVKAICDQL